MVLKMVQKRVSESQTRRIGQLAQLRQWNWTDIYPVFRMVLTDEELKAAGFDPPELVNIEGDNQSGFRLLSEVSIAECKTYLENVLLRDADQMSMAHALEVRAPFMDKDLLEFVFSLPDDFKPIKPGKKLLIDAMGNLLPEEIWNRPKMGFTFPWKYWINHELKEFCEENINYLAGGNVIHQSYLDSLKETMLLPENKEWYKVWNLAVLGFWMKNNKVQFG
jgi:asparagine synthase (glutamine-hydrolysing)